MNKPKTHSMAEHFLQVKSLIDLMPGDERISITYDRKSQDWKITGDNKNGTPLGVYTILKISDDFPYALNTCISDVVTILVRHYNKIYKTQYTSYRDIMQHKGDTRVHREYLDTITVQAKEIEKLKEALEQKQKKDKKDKVVEPTVKEFLEQLDNVDITTPEPKDDPFDAPITVPKSYENTSKKRWSRKKHVDIEPNDLVKRQLIAFGLWEDENPTRSTRGITELDALKEVVQTGVEDLAPYISWRVACHNNVQVNDGVITKEERKLYKRATDRVVARSKYDLAQKKEHKKTLPSSYKKKTTSSGKVNSILNAILGR